MSKKVKKSGPKEWVVKLDDGYYAAEGRWQAVPKEQADLLDAKTARAVAAYLKQPRIGFVTQVERA
jgi:hypothetical protein